MQEKEQKISPIKQRILLFADTLGVSKRDFYKMIGVSRGTLESKTGITEDVVAKFIAVFPDISINWLITGNGKMQNISPHENKCSPIEKDTQTSVGIALHDEHGIPLIPIEAVAGVLSGDDVSVMEYECEHYTIPMFKGAEFLIQVKGDSMQPKYYSGDIVACKRLPLDTFFQWNRVYVVDTEQGVLIKRVRAAADTKHITLVSENSDYAPFEISRKQIYSLALVLGVVRAE